ncbi:hypothetical protein [Thalassotalea profundi]|uniref:Uncharacterized protein n=1 Tax=Thalassotalea profundi TaxID=2036687 RepID=A0ABQ3IIU8_9GAMM|nr:hypothetical protein [Thalassotalea profundi]GHE82966.1 hypothetical protein GCM10011501_09140 [Thalassotalea profundi]
MIFSRVVLILIMVLFLHDVFAQDNSRRRSGPPSNAHSKKAAIPTDAEMYAKTKANNEEFFKQQVERHKKSRQILIDTYVIEAKYKFIDDQGREPIEEEYEEIRFQASIKADKEIAFAIDATRKGVDKNLARYAAYQADVKKQQEEKIAKLIADHEARKLPEDWHHMYVVLNNGMVLRMFKRDPMQSYPYMLYVEKLSGLAHEMGIKENSLFGRARYNDREGTFEYELVIDYSKAFDIPLNYELVKQGCGTIYDSNELSFSIQAPDADDLTGDGRVKQWHAPGTGNVCPFVEMDYANCKVKRCLKRVSSDLDATLMPADATKQAYELAKHHFAEAEKERKSYAEHQAELQSIVAKINQETKRKKQQATRAKCPRAMCDDIVINQFIIDQAWGRSASEKPVW